MRVKRVQPEVGSIIWRGLQQASDHLGAIGDPELGQDMRNVVRGRPE
jgi:hypothetical protein